MRPVLIFSNAKSVRQSKHLLCLNFFLLYPLFPFTSLKRFRFNKKTVVDQPSPSHRKESSSAVASLDSVNDRAGIYRKVATCGDLLRTADFHNVNHQDQLRESVLVSDDYITVRKRLERFILWPTGVLSPGAMRQRGRHAVAFAGRRHLDDPFFMDRMFVEFESR